MNSLGKSYFAVLGPTGTQRGLKTRFSGFVKVYGIDFLARKFVYQEICVSISL